MKSVRSRIERVARTHFTVLIEGESGTGKELVAHQLHELSERRQGPFVSVNCAALVETLIEAELFGIEDRTATGVRGRRGKFEHAEGGTLFLDEIADLSLSAQAKLLRVLQDLSIERVGSNVARRVDTRIIAATNQSLKHQVQRKLFRTDLFYRLSGVDVRVPPLRERKEDIPELLDYFLQMHRRERLLSPSVPVLDALIAHGWPGNVRELQRLVESMVALAPSAHLQLEDLPPRIRQPYDEILAPSLERDDTLRAWASRYAHLVYLKAGRNKRQTCRVLGISYHTLQGYLRGKWLATDRGASRRAEDAAADSGKSRESGTPGQRVDEAAERPHAVDTSEVAESHRDRPEGPQGEPRSPYEEPRASRCDTRWRRAGYGEVARRTSR